LSKCSIVAPKAGIIMGKADYMQQYKSYDNTILDINRLKSSSGGDKLTANNFLSGKPMELVIPAIIVPQQSTFIKHTPITYLSRRFISVPKNPYWPSPDQDEKTEYARLETYILLNPLFNRNSNLLPGIIKQKIHDFVYELCLVRMYEGLRESLSAEEINRLFYEFYQKKLGLNEDESKYVRTFSQKNK
jgi:hypothetical protein